MPLTSYGGYFRFGGNSLLFAKGEYLCYLMQVRAIGSPGVPPGAAVKRDPTYCRCMTIPT